ncbi:ABC transporter permease [Conexibacter sp. S30A1]|uniref:ABC transporter permease n=1 Tax=Conexibacter sp. S30A1 TaxID=2937800 RepID=UPI00200F7BAF|nr:ABC transporter permease [Conexibacter sp. S30A1]
MSTEQEQSAVAETASPPAPGRSALLPAGVRWRSAGILIPFVALFVALSIGSAPFFSTTNLLNIVDQQASTLVIAVAGTFVLISGGIDLSVGATYGLASVVFAELAASGWDPAFAILGAVVAGALVGVVNGVVSTVFRINSLIATLAMSFVVAGLASLVTSGNLVLISNQGASQISTAQFLGVNMSTWVMLAVVVALGFLLARTTYGRYVYAAGGNAEAARFAGVRVNLVRVIAFSLSGAAAALGGVLDSARVLSGNSTNNTTLTFTVVAGIVVGGTSILGGEGAVWRTVVGVLLIALIGNGYGLLSLNPLYEQITLGAIMILAVGVDAWSRQVRG